MTPKWLSSALTLHRCLLVLGSMLCCLPLLGEATVYRGFLKLPCCLLNGTAEKLDRGEYQIEVRIADKTELVFLQDGKTRASVAAEPDAAASGDARLAPLIGTTYMRPSSEPWGSEAERHYSKTGKTQYEEEVRNWNAALRTYASENDGRVIFVFQRRVAPGKWATARFVFRGALEKP